MHNANTLIGWCKNWGMENRGEKREEKWRIYGGPRGFLSHFSISPTKQSIREPKQVKKIASYKNVGGKYCGKS